MPPGLSKPSALPSHLDEEGVVSASRPASRLGLRRQASTQQIVPALPLRPTTPRVAGSRPGTPKVGVAQVAVQAVGGTPTKVSKGVGEAKMDEAVASSAVAAGKDVRSVGTPATVEVAKEKAVEEVKIVGKSLESSKSVVAETQAVPAPTAVSKAVAPVVSQSAATAEPPVQSSKDQTAPSTPSKAVGAKQDEVTSKRQRPGKLDITAAVRKQDPTPAGAAASTPVETLSTPIKSQRAVSQTPSAASRTESPSMLSPVVKSAPRTLRVGQTPKTETPPPVPAFAAPAPIMKLPSRQPSVASINPPGTPSSEQISISDTFSVASTSQSRANSPPPGVAIGSKVGTAPVRSKTKSQVKKERQERAKAIDEEKGDDADVASIAEEPEVEAIISRKKKAKKEKEPRPLKIKTETAQTTPTASRPASPGAGTSAKTVVEVPAPPVKIATPVKAAPVVPQPLIQSPHAEPSPPPTPTLTAASLIAELKATAPELQKCIDSLLRLPYSHHHKPPQTITNKDLHDPALWKADFKLNLTKDEVDALLQGKIPSLHYGGEEGRVWDRGMVTPSGAHLRALQEELEKRFLELEKALRDMPDELRFHPSKPQNEMKFPAIDLEGLKRQFNNATGRGVSVMEQMVQDGSTMKKGAFLVDEASKYINEFVMPPVTPPPSAGGTANTTGTNRGQAVGGAQQMGFAGDVATPQSFEVAERLLGEAKRVVEEKETALRKVVKKNKKLMGLA